MDEGAAAEGPLAGTVAVVTGAARGIGRGIARCLAEAGAIVYVTDRVLHVADLAREYGFTAPAAHSLRGRGARRRYPAGTPGRPVGLEPRPCRP
ncbi:MAG: SDR family NAD(P)-dependent oxidoreductase [Euzebyaceae bacterium]|nr:SDR family NAD(P)-dependent oxidoreductase [Euzebyaceae bacterium]